MFNMADEMLNITSRIKDITLKIKSYEMQELF